MRKIASSLRQDRSFDMELEKILEFLRRRPKIGTSRHSILTKEGVTLDGRVMYFNGCVFAALMPSGQMSNWAEQMLRRVGESLEISDDVVKDSFELKRRLVSKDDERCFMNELVAVLKQQGCSALFFDDFENFAFDGEKLREGLKEYREFIGERLFGVGWRDELRKRKRMRFVNYACGGVLAYPGIARRAIVKSDAYAAFIRNSKSAGLAFWEYMGRTNLSHYWHEYVMKDL